jgi:hypothetical protein
MRERMNEPSAFALCLGLSVAACSSSSGGAGAAVSSQHPDSGVSRPGPDGSGGGAIACPGGKATTVLAPTQLSYSGGEVNVLASDGTTLFFGALGGLYSVPAAGGPLTTLFGGVDAGGQSQVDSLWLGASDVLFIALVNGALQLTSIPKVGGPTTPMATLTNGGGEVALDDTNVYFVLRDYGDGSASNPTHFVASEPRGGGAITRLAPVTGTARNLLADSGYLYWIDQQAADVDAGHYVNHSPLNRVPVGGGPVTTLSTGASPVGLAVDATDVYFTQQAATSQASMRIAKDGSAAATQVSALDGVSVVSQGTAYGFAVVVIDPVTYDVYSGVVWKAPVGGGTTTIMTCDSSLTRPLVLDANHLYAGTTGPNCTAGIAALPL